MAETKIVEKNAVVLRTIAKDVSRDDIITPRIKTILRRMSTALAARADGVALAAPQIGEPLRIFIVSGKVFSADAREENPKPQPDRVFINPVMVKQSRTKEWTEEGCLSVPNWYGEVKRATRATVQALDKNGKAFTLGASGLLAQVFQHEIDHLNGILFTDAARNLTKVEPPATL